VAIAAVDAVAGDVTFVAELDRLLARHVRLGDPGRAVDFVEEAEERGDEKDGAEDTDPRDRVGAAMKDLRHRASGASRRGDRKDTRRSDRLFELTPSTRSARPLFCEYFHIGHGSGALRERKTQP